MKHKQEDFEHLWERARISPTNKLKELKSGKSKTLKINALLQAPLLLAQTSEVEQPNRPEVPFGGRNSNLPHRQKDLTRTANLQEQSTRSKRTPLAKPQSAEQNFYRTMLEEDMRAFREYRHGIGRYE